MSEDVTVIATGAMEVVIEVAAYGPKGDKGDPGAGPAIWTSGVGTPEGAVSAPVGSLFTRTDGGTGSALYVKESGAGNTGWVAK